MKLSTKPLAIVVSLFGITYISLKVNSDVSYACFKKLVKHHLPSNRTPLIRLNVSDKKTLDILKILNNYIIVVTVIIKYIVIMSYCYYNIILLCLRNIDLWLISV